MAMMRTREGVAVRSDDVVARVGVSLGVMRLPRNFQARPARTGIE